MEFLEIIQNCLEIFGIFIRFLDFSIRFMFEFFAKVYEIFSSDTPLGRSTQLSGQQHANIITLFQFNSRIVVENCVVGICNNGMFLEFHEFETKYLAGVYKRH